MENKLIILIDYNLSQAASQAANDMMQEIDKLRGSK